MNSKLVLTSYGLTTGIGRNLIGQELKGYHLADKKIFLFHEPHYTKSELKNYISNRPGIEDSNG